MRTLLRFSIADLSILINADKDYAVANAYRDFYDSESVLSKSIDFKIDLYESSGSHHNKNIKCLFNSGGAWKLYKDKSNCYIVTSGRDKLIIDKSMSNGKLYIKSSRTNGRPFLPFSYPLDTILVINLLIQQNGILVHACGVDDNGRGFLFLGTSGEGKSTTARLWLNERCTTVLSDDRIISRQISGKFYAYGTPWHGDVNISNPSSVETEKIFFLKHSKKNYIKPLSVMDAATRMFVRCFPTFWDKEGMAFTLGFIDEVVRKIPCYEFGFVPDKSAVEFVRGLC